MEDPCDRDCEYRKILNDRLTKVADTIFFDASPAEIQVCSNRYAIATVSLNSVSDRRKLVFFESVGAIDGYATGRGINPDELQRMVRLAMKLSTELIDATDKQVESIS